MASRNALTSPLQVPNPPAIAAMIVKVNPDHCALVFRPIDGFGYDVHFGMPGDINVDVPKRAVSDQDAEVSIPLLFAGRESGVVHE